MTIAKYARERARGLFVGAPLYGRRTYVNARDATRRNATRQTFQARRALSKRAAKIPSQKAKGMSN